MKRLGLSIGHLVQLGVLTTFISLLATPAALAQSGGDSAVSEDRWTFFGGVFWPRINTTVQLTSETLGVSGTLLDMESDLGLDDTEFLPILGVRWRFAKRHALELLYFRLERDGDQTLDIQLSVPCDAVNNCMPGVPDAPNSCGATLCILDAMAVVNTRFDTQVIRLAYQYAFVMRENYELLGSFGVHADKVEIEIRETGLGGPPVFPQPLVEETTLPLPSIGLKYRYRFSPKWAMALNGEWFGVEIGEVEGAIVSFQGGVTWDVWERTSLLLAWNYFDLDVDAGDSNLTGSFSWEYSGPVFGVKFGF